MSYPLFYPLLLVTKVETLVFVVNTISKSFIKRRIFKGVRPSNILVLFFTQTNLTCIVYFDSHMSHLTPPSRKEVTYVGEKSDLVWEVRRLETVDDNGGRSPNS